MISYGLLSLIFAVCFYMEVSRYHRQFFMSSVHKLMTSSDFNVCLVCRNRATETNTDNSKTLCFQWRSEWLTSKVFTSHLSWLFAFLKVHHTHTHLTTTRVSRYQKAKTNWILLKQETLSGSGISWAMCMSAPRSRQITTPAPHLKVHHAVFMSKYCTLCSAAYV